jgi:rhamnosyltransferase
MNIGLAEAHNVGIDICARKGYSHVLLLDQDSTLSPNMVHNLLHAESILLDSGKKIAGISPQIIDENTGALPCVCRYVWFTAHRIGKTMLCNISQQTDTIISSGALIRISALQVIGVMRGDLFIDHVDTEWALRSQYYGYMCYCAPSAILYHRIGDATRNIFGKNIFLHSNIRHYYQLRNEVYLVRTNTMGLQWRAYILPRILYHFVLFLFLSDNYYITSQMLFKAVCDGITGKLGKSMLPVRY